MKPSPERRNGDGRAPDRARTRCPCSSYFRRPTFFFVVTGFIVLVSDEPLTMMTAGPGAEMDAVARSTPAQAQPAAPHTMHARAGGRPHGCCIMCGSRT